MLASMVRVSMPLLLSACSQPFEVSDKVVGEDTATPVDTGTTPTTETAELPSLEFTSPEAMTASPATLSVTATGDVQQVSYWLDTLPLGESTDASTGFSVSWDASALGTQTLVARGYDAAGTEIADTELDTRVTVLERENRLGVWLESVDATGLTHEDLAATLAALGVKRVYIQVGEGNTSCEAFPEICDATIPAAYHALGIEAFAWSRPSENAPSSPANIITLASDIAYDGFVVFLDAGWGGQSQAMAEMGQAARTAVNTAIENRRAFPGWPLYVMATAAATAEELRVDLLDSYVDGYLPRVYVEQAGGDWLADPAAAVAATTCDYLAAGATQEIHPVVDSLTGTLDAAGINAFLGAAGAGGSLWAVPPSGDPSGILTLWTGIDWTAPDLPEHASCG